MLTTFTLPTFSHTWGDAGFIAEFLAYVERLDPQTLLLQQALTQSSYVSPSPHRAILLNSRATTEEIHLKVGIMYAGIIAGSCCADDPNPVCEQNEYCELLFCLHRHRAQATLQLLTAA